MASETVYTHSSHLRLDREHSSAMEAEAVIVLLLVFGGAFLQTLADTGMQLMARFLNCLSGGLVGSTLIPARI